MLLRTLTQDEARRDWREVERALADAERLTPLPVQVVVIRAEMLMSSHKSSAARTLLLEKPECT
jgi:hypothetical protein